MEKRNPRPIPLSPDAVLRVTFAEMMRLRRHLWYNLHPDNPVAEIANRRGRGVLDERFRESLNDAMETVKQAIRARGKKEGWREDTIEDQIEWVDEEGEEHDDVSDLMVKAWHEFEFTDKYADRTTEYPPFSRNMGRIPWKTSMEKTVLGWGPQGGADYLGPDSEGSNMEMNESIIKSTDPIYTFEAPDKCKMGIEVRWGARRRYSLDRSPLAWLGASAASFRFVVGGDQRRTQYPATSLTTIYVNASLSPAQLYSILDGLRSWVAPDSVRAKEKGENWGQEFISQQLRVLAAQGKEVADRRNQDKTFNFQRFSQNQSKKFFLNIVALSFYECATMIFHEITHGIDPGIRKRKQKKRIIPEEDFPEYLNQPHEVRAFTQQIWQDVSSHLYLESVKTGQSEKEIAENLIFASDGKDFPALIQKLSPYYNRLWRSFNKKNLHRVLSTIYQMMKETK